MSRIAAANIGIEHLSLLTLSEQDIGLPRRYALLPDGQSIEPHSAQLYPAYNSERVITEFATPDQSFRSLLRPQDFYSAIHDLHVTLAQSESPELLEAASLLATLKEDEQLLRMSLNLLHKV